MGYRPSNRRGTALFTLEYRVWCIVTVRNKDRSETSHKWTGRSRKAIMKKARMAYGDRGGKVLRVSPGISYLP